MKKPREFTNKEVKKQFLDHVRMIVKEWDTGIKNRSQTERLNGVAFSILAAIDGCSVNVPAFILAPAPHKDDKEYLIKKGENYYPENDDSKINCDIAGCLHDSFYKKNTK